MGRLLLFFLVVPLVELALLIELGWRIGTPATIAVIIVTGVTGAALARYQGLGVLRHVQAELAARRLPAGSLVDGVIILLAAALLVTPGILTDTIGFLCLIPAIRRRIKTALWRYFERRAREGRWRASVTLEP